MSIVRWAPREKSVFHDLMNMQSEMNRLFTNFWNDEPSITNWSPSVDIAEGKDEFTVKVELPGIDKKDVKVTVQDNVLMIQGEKKQESETKEKNYHRVERSFGSFARSFRLPSLVKADKIEAQYKDGILSITLPKSEEAKAKEIEVKF